MFNKHIPVYVLVCKCSTNTYLSTSFSVNVQQTLTCLHTCLQMFNKHIPVFILVCKCSSNTYLVSSSNASTILSFRILLKQSLTIAACFVRTRWSQLGQFGNTHVCQEVIQSDKRTEIK